MAPADVVDGEIIEDLDIPGVHVDLNVGEVRVGHAGVCGVFELIGGEHLALELTVAVLHDLGIAPAVFSIGERTILCRKRSGADIVEVTDRVLQFLDEPLGAEQGGLSQNESRAAGKAAGIKGVNAVSPSPRKICSGCKDSASAIIMRNASTVPQPWSWRVMLTRTPPSSATRISAEAKSMTRG